MDLLDAIKAKYGSLEVPLATVRLTGRGAGSSTRRTAAN
jgi:hypothetical protein